MEIENGVKYGSFIRNFALLACSFSIMAVALGFAYTGIGRQSDIDTSVPVKQSLPIVVIDPGHGGEDGGAVAGDGTAEKVLNLEFAATLHNICGLLGTDSVMTRETDTLLYDKYSDLQDYTGKKKVYDLKNRLRFTEETGDNTVFVGIHMNKFSDPKYSGTQIYYSSNNTASMSLANMLQDRVKNSLQPENNRAVKRAGTSIFLLKRLNSPAILAECGFLSNEAETERLKSAEYKKEFSLATAVTLGEFIKSNGNPK